MICCRACLWCLCFVFMLWWVLLWVVVMRGLMCVLCVLYCLYWVVLCYVAFVLCCGACVVLRVVSFRVVFVCVMFVCGVGVFVVLP